MSSNANCPYCQAPLNVTATPGAGPTVCPHCLSNLENPLTVPVGEAPNVLRDIRTGWLSIPIRGRVLSGLIAACVLSILGCYVALRFTKPYEDIVWVIFLMGGFAVLDVLVIVAVAQLLGRFLLRGDRQAATVVLNSFVYVLLLVLLVPAVVAFFFAVCYRMIN